MNSALTKAANIKLNRVSEIGLTLASSTFYLASASSDNRKIMSGAG